MRKATITILLSLVLVAGGCAPWKIETRRNNQNLMSLNMGMSKSEIISIMGAPDFNEAYKSLHGNYIVILFYYTQRKWADGAKTKDECTPVVIENGELVGWGDEFYKSKMEIDVNIKRQ